MVVETEEERESECVRVVVIYLNIGKFANGSRAGQGAGGQDKERQAQDGTLKGVVYLQLRVQEA